MNELILVRPSAQYADQVMEYRAEMLANGDTLDGCAGLEDVSCFSEWIDFDNRLKRKYGDGYVPSDVFLAVRRSDLRVVGIADFRHPLSEFLLRFGGSIGYSVRPSERRKGYASQMLRFCSFTAAGSAKSAFCSHATGTTPHHRRLSSQTAAC